MIGKLPLWPSCIRNPKIPLSVCLLTVACAPQEPRPDPGAPPNQRVTTTVAADISAPSIDAVDPLQACRRLQDAVLRFERLDCTAATKAENLQHCVTWANDANEMDAPHTACTLGCMATVNTPSDWLECGDRCRAKKAHTKTAELGLTFPPESCKRAP